MKIFSKTKAALALCLAVLVAGFAFAATQTVTTTLWDDGQTFGADPAEAGVITLTGTTAKAGDKLVITYTNAGSADQDASRAESPRRDMKRFADIVVFIGGQEADRFEQIQGEGTEEYVFTADLAATTALELRCRNLTVTKVELQATEEFPDGEYLVDADFAKLDGWTQVHSGQFWDMGFGLIGTYQVRGEHPAATVDATHLATEYCVGLECRWQTNYAALTQVSRVIPAGKWVLSYDVENTNATTTKATYENRFWVKVGDQTIVDQQTEWMNGKSAWTTHRIDFELTEAQTVEVSLGYGTGSNNFGVGNTPALFVSHLKLVSELQLAQDMLQDEITKAQALLTAAESDGGKTELEAAITAAQGKLQSTDLAEIAAAIEALQAAEEAFADAQELAENTEEVEGAKVDEPVATDYVANGDFNDTKDTDGWQSTGGFQNQGIKSANDNAAGAMNDSKPWYENWNATATPNRIFKVVKNIPNGTYKLDIRAFVKILAEAPTGEARGAFKAGEATQQVQFVFANDDKVYLTDNVGDYEVYTEVTDNQMTIGLEQTEAVSNWMGVDNVKLTYYGTECTKEQAYEADHAEEKALAEAKANLQAAIDAAQALLDNEENTEGRDALQAAIAAATALLESTDLAAVTAGIDELNGAVDTFVTANDKNFAQEGTFYLRNVATQKFLGAANNWGTQASLVDEYQYVKLAKLNDGKFTIESMVSNGGTNYYFSGSYMDGPALQVEITKKDGYWTISANGQYFGYDGSSNVVTTLESATDNALWQILSEAEIADEIAARKANLANATADSPADATFLIKDANFGRNRRDAEQVWTIVANNKNLRGGGDNGNGCAESYHSAFTLSQTLAAMPKGVYKLTAQGFYRQDGTDNDNLPVFYINDQTSTFPVKTGSENDMTSAGASFLTGAYTAEPMYAEMAAEGDITIGAKLEVNTSLWCIWDNFQLTYYGPTATLDEVKNGAILAELNDLKAKAEELLNTVDNDEVKATLTAAIAGADGVSGADAINAAIEALNAAVDLGEANVIAQDVLPKMKAFTETTNFYTAEALAAYYDEPYAKYQAGTLTKAEAQALQDPNATTSWRGENRVDDLLMSVWDVEPMNWDTYHVNTWSIEGSSDGTNFLVPFIEYWTGDGESLAAKTLTAEILGLEAGDYEVSAWVRVRVKNGDTNAANGITMQVNEGEAVDVCAGDQVGTSQFYLAEITATGTVEEGGALKLVFNVAADNNISWLSFKNVMYTKKGETPVEEDSEVILFTEDDVCSAGDIAATYSSEEGNFVLTTNDTGGKMSVDANNCYFGTAEKYTKYTHRLKTGGKSTATNSLALTIPEDGKLRVCARSASGSATDRNLVLTQSGTELYNKVVQDGDAIEVDMGGSSLTKVYPVIEVSVKAGTVDITYPVNGINFYAFEFVSDGTPTGISTVENSRTVEGIFNLRGQRVENPTKGLYIIGGKKVVLK